MDTSHYESKFGMKSLFPKCSPSDMAAYESTLGVSLPNDYRNFLMQWNGVFFPKADAAFMPTDAFDEDEEGWASFLYGLDTETELHDLRRMQKGYAFNERVPKGIIAIGDDNSWNRVCLAIEGKDAGMVYWWYPGEPWEPGENVPTRDYLSPVAPSFKEFWDALYPRSDD